MTNSTGPDILSVQDLTMYYSTKGGTVKAVDGVSFHSRKGSR